MLRFNPLFLFAFHTHRERKTHRKRTARDHSDTSLDSKKVGARHMDLLHSVAGRECVQRCEDEEGARAEVEGEEGAQRRDSEVDWIRHFCGVVTWEHQVFVVEMRERGLSETEE